METISPPLYKEEVVLDLDVAFVGDIPYSLTLPKSTVIEETRDILEIIVSPTRKVTLERRNILWWSTDERVKRTQVDKEGKPVRLPGAIHPSKPT